MKDDSMPKDTQENDSEKQKFNWKEELISWGQVFVIAALIAFVLNRFIIANSRVPSASMENTIMTHDRVIGSRLAYNSSDPKRGDIVIFYFPDDVTEKTYYVKRIIGLPGDIIDIKHGHVYLNNSDTPLEEPYIKEPMETPEDLHYEVPEGCYFMLGDNRNSSADSRYWHNTFVKKEKIVAKVLFRYFPSIGKIQ
ncbi:MAG: signal peptidase I [Hungatella sp.]|nr:signal peptidase I [Hungatella sp.]